MFSLTLIHGTPKYWNGGIRKTGEGVMDGTWKQRQRNNGEERRVNRVTYKVWPEGDF